MSAHVLMNLLNKLGKRDKMRGLPSILSLFRIGLNNILFKVLLTYYDIYIHTIFLGFDGKR